MEITSGKIKSAQKVIVYGPEGVGKTTFASHFPDPVFIDTEGSTKRLDVKRLPNPTSWEMLLENVRYITKNPSCCKTLVIDTGDWAEKLCANNIVAKFQVRGIEDIGYGKGYVYLYEDFGRLLNLLNEVIAKEINVLICAHAQMRKFEQPQEFGSYDRWELKLTKQVAPMVKEWADMILFANYETVIVKDANGKAKAQGNKRVMFTTHHACWDAKNREGFPDKVKFDYSEIASAFENNANDTATETQTAEPLTDSKSVDDDDVPFTLNNDLGRIKEKSAEPISDEPDYVKKLRDIMKANKVTDYEIISVVTKRGYFPPGMEIADYPREFVEGVLIGAWEQVYKQVELFRDDAF